MMIFDNILDQETFIDAFNLCNISFENDEALVCKYIPVFTEHDDKYRNLD